MPYPEDLDQAVRDRLAIAPQPELHTLLIEANSLLRTAHHIACRQGARTNWDAFQDRVKEALDRQHELMFLRNNE